MSVNLNLTDDEAHVLLTLLRRIRAKYDPSVAGIDQQLQRIERLGNNLSEVRRKLEALGVEP